MYSVTPLESETHSKIHSKHSLIPPGTNYGSQIILGD
jgi:hypothetical protein